MLRRLEGHSRHRPPQLFRQRRRVRQQGSQRQHLWGHRNQEEQHSEPEQVQRPQHFKRRLCAEIREPSSKTSTPCKKPSAEAPSAASSGASTKAHKEKLLSKCSNKENFNSKELELIVNEISIIKELDHPNILKVYEAYEDKEWLYIVTELIHGGELFDEISKRLNFTEIDAAVIIKQILEAMSYCHGVNIVHKDLKPENLLLQEKDNVEYVKVIDFGTAQKFDTNTKMNKVCPHKFINNLVVLQTLLIAFWSIKLYFDVERKQFITLWYSTSHISILYYTVTINCYCLSIFNILWKSVANR